MNFEFRFKQFGINHSSSSMKIGTDAILLGAFANVDQVKSILEIGCGCGIISLMLSQRSNAIIESIDTDENSVKQASENFNASPWHGRMKAYHEDARTFQSNPKFDLIVSNPPYFSNSLKPLTKTKLIAHHNDSLNYMQLCQAVSNNLNPNGSFWLILPTSIYSIFSVEATKQKLYCNKRIEISNKPSSPISLFVSSWSKNATETKVEQFSIHNSKGNYSSEFTELTKDFYLDF